MAPKKDIESIAYLSPLQEGLLFHAVADRAADPYFIQSAFAIEGRLDPDRFARAWQTIVDRHAILRTGFAWEDVPRPVQIARRRVTLPINRHDWRGRGEAEREAALAALLVEDRAAGFDLFAAPLMRVALIRLDDDRCWFVLSHHHLVLDGWSLALLLREVLLCYRDVGLVPARPYREYVAWVQARDTAAAEQFWRTTLAGFATPTPLPGDGGNADLVDPALPCAESTLRFDAVATDALIACARRHRITTSTLIQAAWALLLARHAGERDVVFGATVSGRPPELAGSDRMVGLLINTVPVRVQIRPELRLAAWLERLHAEAGALRPHEWTPLTQVQRWSDVPAGRPLFESIVVFDSYPEDDAADDLQVVALPRAGREVDGVLVTTARNSYPLSLIVEPAAELRLILSYQLARLTPDGAARLLEQLRTLVTAMVDHPDAPVATLPLVGADERTRVVLAEPTLARGECLHERVEAHARRAPDATAVVFEETRVTYAELDRRARRIARRLHADGVTRGDRVAIALDRSADVVVAILGVLKAGAAYVPIDRKMPAERQRAVIDDSGARAVIDADFVAADDDRPLGQIACPGDLAYVIYTSGSTGRPKGVAVEHRQLVAYVDGVLARLGLPDGASFAMVSTFAADLGHTALFGALASGGTLHVLSDDRTFDPDRTAAYMSRHAVDALKIVPSHLTALLDAAEPSRVLPRRALVLGGEASTWALVQRVQALAPCAVFNHYGPTETTVGALVWRVDALTAAATVPIGRPLPGVRACVLDRELELVPAGVVGELYLGGDGVARGYHQRPDLTAERFVPDPFGPPGARLYRTGDRVRLGLDGAIEFLGRTDHQIKLRGFRIEPGEIEAHLRAEPTVRDALVVARDDGGARQLVAYVTPRDGTRIDPQALATALARRLPDYMVPAAFVPLPALPLTANGKIDRAALPAPGAPAASHVYQPPRTPVEAALAEIWTEILGVERVGIDDNFFAIGGDSIRTLQVIARANRRGIRLSPKHLFDHPTIAAAAAVAIVDDAPREVAPVAAPARDEYPLSPMQEGMLFHTLLQPGSGIYLMQQHYTWTGPLDTALLEAAWAKVVARHPILRTSFRWRDLERPLQVVEPTIDRADVVHVLDWRDLDPATQDARLDEVLAAELADGFPLDTAPLWRLRVVRVADDRYRIVRSFHHILTDDWCFSVLMMECLSFYGALREGRALELPVPRPYRDYIDWLARKDLRDAERFWRDELRGFSAATPLGVERASPVAGGIADVHAALTETETEPLVALAQRHALTVNTLVQGAWALLLSRYSGERDVVFGVTVAGRPTELPGVETIVGLFINSLPLRVRVAPERPVVAWLQELLARNYRIREHEYPPLLQIQQWSELPRGEELFKSLVVFENAPVDPSLGQQVGDVDLGFDHDRVHTNYPMTVVAYPGARLGIRLSYDRRWLDDDVVARMLDHLLRLLQEIGRRPEARLGDLAMLADAERARLVEPAAAAMSTSGSYVELFTAQARRTPDAIAVTCGERRLSYRDVYRAADAIAGALRAAEVAPDTLVAVLAERDEALVSAVVGVLMAGGAYLPLDPTHPAPRLGAVIANSRPAVVLTSVACAPRLYEALSPIPESQRPRVLLRERLGARQQNGRAAGPRHLAYVIHTSGSTGTPKGAMVEHAAMLNNVWGKIPALELSAADVIGQTAPQCFDISVWQLLTGLLCGARVHVVPDEIVADPQRLLAEVERERVTVLELVPSLLRELVDSDGAPRLTALRWMLPTGEALPVDLCRRWFERYPRVPLINAYGPAECADDVALHVIAAPPPADATSVPIGRAVPGARLHVVSGDELAPVGVLGELCVGGLVVGRGYVGDPVRTAAAFVPDPWSDAPGARLYRTGDLARRRPDGTLEFAGRRDHQVKIRGVRVELGEIEARLREHPAVDDAAVVVRDDRLVAYVVGGGDAEGLRSYLAARLPDAMVPRLYVTLQALPRSANGKVDRRALPAPALDERAVIAPRTPTEEVLAGIWSDVLGVARVGVHDGFFELGGHSLLATQVASRVRRAFGVELPLRSLFDHPTVAALARDVDARRAGPRTDEAPLVPVPRGGPLPLTFAQQRLWFVDQLEPGSATYNMTAAVRIEGNLDRSRLARAFGALIARHEALRTRFDAVDGEPVQIVVDDAGFELEIVEGSGSFDAIASVRAEQPFDLRRAPLFRATLIHIDDATHVLVLVVHHIVADGWSLNVMVSELAELYQGGTLAALPIQLPDYAVWQRAWMQGPMHEAQLGYWRQRLAGAPTELALPADRPRAASPTGARHVMTIDRELSDALRVLARREGATLFMTLLAAYQVLLHRRTGQEDLLIGTDVANRHRAETEGLIGFFVNLLVLRAELGGTPSFRELLQRVRTTTLDAYAHQDLPFEQVVDAVRPARTSGRHPLVQTLFVLQNVPAREIDLPDLQLRALELEHEVSRFELAVFVEESDDGLVATWKYRADRFEPATIASLADELVAVLRAMVADPDQRVTAPAKPRARRLRDVAPRRIGGELVTARAMDGGMPLVVEPVVGDVDLVAWAGEQRDRLERDLVRHGAILFRGFRLTSPAEFERVAQAVCGELFGEYGDLPREKSGGRVYGSTPYPAEEAILFHNESSHLPRWPLKQWFFCVQAAPEGGATPIVDGRRVHGALSEPVRARLRDRGLLYVRNFTPGFDVRWQDFFHTDDPAVVEARCREAGMRCEWLDGGRLRTGQRGPAIVTHPRTGEPVVFNQIQLHHPAFLAAPVRSSLLAMVGAEWLPRNVLYGDGAPIDDDVIDELTAAYERCAVRFPWQPGDVLLLDNMLVAHGRDPFRGPRKIVVAMGEMVGA